MDTVIIAQTAQVWTVAQPELDALRKIIVDGKRLLTDEESRRLAKLTKSKSEAPTLDLDTDLWTMTASDGRTIYAPTANECAEMCKCFEIVRGKLDLYDSDGQHSAAADYAFEAYADHCADQV